MKPFIVLISVFVAGICFSYLITGQFHEKLCGKLALSLMLLFTAFWHFKFVTGLSMMVPQFIPSKRLLIYFTGVVEILFAFLLWVSSVQYEVSLLLIGFLIGIFPANIKAAFKNVNIKEADYNGPGPSYLWIRVPLQFLLLFWIYIFCL